MTEILTALISGAVAILVCVLTNRSQSKRLVADASRVATEQARIENEATKKGLQALLRDRLYQSYNKHMELGYAPIYAKENFLNMYDQYHNLGANGVMDRLKDEFMDLPTERREAS